MRSASFAKSSAPKGVCREGLLTTGNPVANPEVIFLVVIHAVGRPTGVKIILYAPTSSLRLTP